MQNDGLGGFPNIETLQSCQETFLLIAQRLQIIYQLYLNEITYLRAELVALSQLLSQEQIVNISHSPEKEKSALLGRVPKSKENQVIAGSALIGMGVFCNLLLKLSLIQEFDDEKTNPSSQNNPSDTIKNH